MREDYLNKRGGNMMTDTQKRIIQIFKILSFGFVLLGILFVYFTSRGVIEDEIFKYVGYAFVAMGLLDFLVLPSLLEKAFLKSQETDNKHQI